MDLRRLGPGEWLAGASGVALLVSLFLPWYDVELPSVPAGSGFGFYGDISGTLSGWEALSAIDVVLALVACAGVLMAVMTAAQGVPAVPLAISALMVPIGSVGVILVLIRLLDLPDWAGGRAWGIWVGLAGSVGIVAGCVIAMRDEIRPGAAEPDIQALPAPRP